MHDESYSTTLYLDCPGDLHRHSSLYKPAVFFPRSLLAEGPGHLPTLLSPAPPGAPAPPLWDLPALQAGLVTPLVRSSDAALQDDGPDPGVAFSLPA